MKTQFLSIRASWFAQIGLVTAGFPAVVCAGDMPRADRWAWGENIGWINFEGQPDGAGRVRFFPDGLSGYAWGENVGWINVGQGGDYPPPGSQGGPIFTGDSSFGVRIEGQPGDSTRPLSGWAWGENIGWLNFNTWDLGTLDSDGQLAGARIEAGRLRGYAWAENVGWINLDDDEHFVSVEFECGLADLAEPFFVLDLADIVAFVDAFITGEFFADLAPPIGMLDLADINAFVASFNLGCP